MLSQLCNMSADCIGLRITNILFVLMCETSKVVAELSVLHFSAPLYQIGFLVNTKLNFNSPYNKNSENP